MSNIYETKYYAERRDRGTNAIDLQLKYRDEIEKCLEDDEMYQVFKKDKKDYYQQKYPDLNGEKFDQYMRCVVQKCSSCMLMTFSSVQMS